LNFIKPGDLTTKSKLTSLVGWTSWPEHYSKRTRGRIWLVYGMLSRWQCIFLAYSLSQKHISSMKKDNSKALPKTRWVSLKKSHTFNYQTSFNYTS
jgi:hypothetical protein